MLKLNLQRSDQRFSRSKPRHCAIAHLACDEIEKAFTKDKIGTRTVAEKTARMGHEKMRPATARREGMHGYRTLL